MMIKFNYSAGEPAPERITDRIYEETQRIESLRIADIGDVDLSAVGAVDLDGFSVEVIDPVADYLATLEEVFDFGLLRGLLGAHAGRHDADLKIGCVIHKIIPSAVFARESPPFRSSETQFSAEK